VDWTTEPPVATYYVSARGAPAPTDTIAGLTEGLEDLIDQDEADACDVGVPAQDAEPDEISLADTE
jgi:hypothetical protein